jgi:putative MATE family efflux protein
MARDKAPTIDTEKKAFYRKVLSVALPISLQSLLASSLNLSDNLMVGSLGDTELATVGISTQIFFIFWMLLYGFTGGTVTYNAQFWGVRDLKNIRHVTGISISFCFTAGLIFFLAGFLFPEYVLKIFTNIPEVIVLGEPYVKYGAFSFLFTGISIPLASCLKATQQTQIPFRISLTAILVNIGVCIVLIFGIGFFPKLGVLGACFGTVIARTLELSLYIIVIFARKNIVAGPIKDFFSWDKILYKKVIKNSIPTTLNEVGWGFGTSLYSAAIGRLSVVEFAAWQAGNTIFNLFSLFCFAIGDATLILVGEQLGAGRLEKALTASKRMLKVGVIVGLAAGVTVVLFSQLILGLFDFTPEGDRYTTYIILILAALLFLRVYNATIVTGLLRAGGDTTFALLGELSTVWLVGVPLAFFTALYLHLPVYFVVLAVQLEEIVKFFIMHHRYKSKKWLRNLISTT